MAKADWDTKEFNFHGGYLTYQGKFVARHKHRIRGAAPAFKKFLLANFTPTEYFALRDADMAPLHILESKGFLYPHVAEACVRAGFSPTRDGFKAMIQADMCKYA